jgi:hypothetical protein
MFTQERFGAGDVEMRGFPYSNSLVDSINQV